jgi:hypothetical protein
MKIELTKIKIRDVYEGYKDSQAEGVVAYGGRLDIRPKYQREFVYKEKQRNAVVETVMKGFPLNSMYWVKKEDGNYEVLDGQQRTISICQYLQGDFSIDEMYFHNLQKDRQDAILDYDMYIYVCEGGDTEKLEWFRIINIAGEKLTDQELRNAVYSGEWLTQAKRYFSKQGCAGASISERYVSVSVVRQELLELAIEWIATKQGRTIEEYMSIHQHDVECAELWEYFQEVIAWIPTVFVDYRRREMQRVDWGELYLRFGDRKMKPLAVKAEVDRLMADEDVTNKPGIYRYIFTQNERDLNIRAFNQSEKRQKYEEQGGICPACNMHFSIEEMEADHVQPWSEGGKTRLDNCQMLCKECNRKKGNK